MFDTTVKETIQNCFLYTVRHGAFDIAYDKRDLARLETLGCAQSMIKAFYDDEDLYSGDSDQ